jgi:hypothetical protein
VTEITVEKNIEGELIVNVKHGKSYSISRYVNADGTAKVTIILADTSYISEPNQNQLKREAYSFYG